MQRDLHNSPRAIVVQAVAIVVISGIIGLANNPFSSQPLPLNYRVIRNEKKNVTLIALERIHVPPVHLAEARHLLDEGGARFLDARRFDSFKDGHIPGALSLPVVPSDDFDAFRGSALLGMQKDDPIVTYCGESSCHLSVQLAEKLKNLGFTNLRAFVGGWEEWQKAKLPISKGEANKRAALPPAVKRANPVKPSLPEQGTKVPTPSLTGGSPAKASRNNSAPPTPSKGEGKSLSGPRPVPDKPKPGPETSRPPAKPAPANTIGLPEAYETYRRGNCIFVDSRPQEDFEKGHITGAVSLPLETFDESFLAVAPKLASGNTIVVYCDGKDCNSSTEVADKLRERLGSTRILAFVGGWKEWKQARYPLESGGG